MIKGYRDGGRKAAGSLWSEVITTRGLEWKRQGEMMARIRPGWRVSTGLRASSESPINQSCQPPGPPSIWLGKAFTWSKSQEIFSTDFKAIDLMDSFGTAIRKCWLGQWGCGGGWEESPSPQHAFCFMAACPHLRGKVDREAVFLLAWNKWPVGISGYIWPFGSNQWPRNQNSLVLISSRAVKIIGRGGLH